VFLHRAVLSAPYFADQHRPGNPIALILGLLVWLCLAPSVAHTAEPRKVVIDTDPGTDDALAILLALNSPELDVKAFTVVPGNVVAEQGLENALKLVSLAGRCDVPVAGGAKRPLAQKLTTAEFWHGKNGLANIELPAPKCRADSRFAPDLIIELVQRFPNQITLVPVGPLTNLALAFLKKPAIVPLVKEVVLMGGSLSGGNVNAAAEANIANDPEAAQIVFTAGWPVTMVGLDVGDKTLFTRAHLAQLGKTHGAQNNFAAAVLKFLVDLSEQYGFTGTPMYDPLAVGAALDRSLVSTQYMRVDVETRGEFTRGETVGNRHNAVERGVLHGDRYVIEGLDPVTPNAHVCVRVDAERFIQLLIARLQGK
jgi:inosine-uridine nucleoside N-ribohydrolase